MTVPASNPDLLPHCLPITRSETAQNARQPSPTWPPDQVSQAPVFVPKPNAIACLTSGDRPATFGWPVLFPGNRTDETRACYSAKRCGNGPASPHQRPLTCHPGLAKPGPGSRKHERLRLQATPGLPGPGSPLRCVRDDKRGAAAQKRGSDKSSDILSIVIPVWHRQDRELVNENAFGSSHHRGHWVPDLRYAASGMTSEGQPRRKRGSDKSSDILSIVIPVLQSQVRDPANANAFASGQHRGYWVPDLRCAASGMTKRGIQISRRNRSSQFGLFSSMSRIFQARRQRFSCFSRLIAQSISSCTS